MAGHTGRIRWAEREHPHVAAVLVDEEVRGSRGRSFHGQIFGPVVHFPAAVHHHRNVVARDWVEEGMGGRYLGMLEYDLRRFLDQVDADQRGLVTRLRELAQ